jgi:hypothetical protein
MFLLQLDRPMLYMTQGRRTVAHSSFPGRVEVAGKLVWRGTWLLLSVLARPWKSVCYLLSIHEERLTEEALENSQLIKYLPFLPLPKCEVAAMKLSTRAMFHSSNVGI